MPTTIPSTVACAKIRIPIPINAATIQSALIGAFSHGLTPLMMSLLLLGWSTTNGRHDEHASCRSEARRSIIRSERMHVSTIHGTVCEEAVGRPSIREAR